MRCQPVEGKEHSVIYGGGSIVSNPRHYPITEWDFRQCKPIREVGAHINIIWDLKASVYMNRMVCFSFFSFPFSFFLFYSFSFPFSLNFFTPQKVSGGGLGLCNVWDWETGEGKTWELGNKKNAIHSLDWTEDFLAISDWQAAAHLYSFHPDLALSQFE